MLHDPLSDSLSIIKNAETSGKHECSLNHVSNVLKEILTIMKKTGYITDFEEVQNNRGGEIKIKLAGKINDCKTIIPRYPLKKEDYEKWEKRFLPASGVGTLIISTSKGIKDHKETRGKVGGVLIAYVY